MIRDAPSAAAEAALSRLAEAVRHDLECLDYPSRPWVRPRYGDSGEPVYDVVIVGGGQSGLGAAFGLMREHIENILVIDENPEGHEGPWITYARMATLRTPKYLTGPDLSIPSLTFRHMVGSAIRPRKLADARQDPARGMDAVFVLVPRHAADSGAQRD